MVLGWVFLIRGDAVWIVLTYRLDRTLSAGSYRIGWIVSGNTGFYALDGYWMDGTDRLNGALAGRGWGGPTFAGAGMGAPPLAP